MKQIEVVAAIIRKEDKIFATQRGYGEWKDWWEFPGGKIEAGETPEEALKREVFEELGIRDFEPVALGHYVFESKRESELVYVNKTVYDGQVNPSQEELDGGRFWSRQEIADAIGKGVFTPNFEHEYQQFFGKTTL
jgi:mutator protein MutT